MRRVYRFAPGRLARNLTGLLPLIGFPIVLHLSGHADLVLYGLFGGLAALLVTAVVLSAARYKLVVDAQGLDCRGRLHHRRLDWADVNSATVRRGRGKPTRFMGPPPFRELVLSTADRRVVISSLPLGEENFEAVLAHLGECLPDSVLRD